MDGPGGAGKTAIGRRLARELGYRFLDTGVLYRAVTYKRCRTARRHGRRGADASCPGPAHRAGPARRRLTTIVVDGTDVTDRLRAPEIDRNVASSRPCLA